MSSPTDRPAPHDPDPRDVRRPCRVCGITVRYVRPGRGRRGYFQHVATPGFTWRREYDRLHGGR